MSALLQAAFAYLWWFGIVFGLASLILAFAYARDWLEDRDRRRRVESFERLARWDRKMAPWRWDRQAAEIRRLPTVEPQRELRR